MNGHAVREALGRISPFIKKTPLLESELLSKKFGKGYKIFLKCENFQVTRSYKPRGALNALMVNSPTAVIARSSGNFAQALAWAGKQLGTQVTVVMPEDAPKTKIERTRMQGAKVVLEPPSYELQHKKVEELLKENPQASVLSAFDDYDVIAGQGTVALEVLNDLRDFAAFFAPIGGGGLMAGCSRAIKQDNPGILTIGVEPEGAKDYFLSRQKGEKCTLKSTNTIADGLRTPAVGEKNRPLLNRFVDDVWLVTDRHIVSAMKILCETVGIVVEPSGAASFAAILANPDWQPEGDMVFVISGGNIDAEVFFNLLFT